MVFVIRHHDGEGGGGGSNVMKGHYFTKLVTEQQRLGDISCRGKTIW